MGSKHEKRSRHEEREHRHSGKYDNSRNHGDRERKNEKEYERDYRKDYDKRDNEERYYKDKRRDKRYREDDDEKFNRDYKRRERSRSRSRSQEGRHRKQNEGFRRRQNSEEKNYKWGKQSDESDKKPAADKEKPNFGLSGKLAAETNTFRGVVIKYSEPPEACKPKRRWRLYPFKGEKALPTLYIHRESAYLMGRDRKIADFPLDHPSCSKQHAVLQYRLVPFIREDGSTGKRVRPYLIDLESANGTYINNKKMEPRKYYELLEKDVIKFGYSTREYVLLHENSKDEAQDDDVKEEEVQVKKEEN